MNIEILTQGTLLIGLMLITLAPELIVIAKETPNKALLFVLGILSKITAIYFFTSTISGSILN